MSLIPSTVRRMETPELVRSLKRYIPDISQMEEYLRKNPEEHISILFPFHKRSIPGIKFRINKTEKTLEKGTRVLKKVLKDGERVNLNKKEKLVLASIIVNHGRPAFLIQDGTFPSLTGLPPNWLILDDYRKGIENTSKSVGRIEPYKVGDPDAPGGTGFLVAEDVVMTNRHVVDPFCFKGDDMTWIIREKTKPRIDYFEEFGATAECEFTVKKIIGIHDTLDIALLRVEKESTLGTPLPEPLILDSELPDPIQGRKVYVVGYPFQASTEDNRDDVDLVFNNILGCKRLQPGEVTGVEMEQCLFYHDCSTIGGNSGSCVVDLEKNKVIGLHFGGKVYEFCNRAIALPNLKNDEMFQNAGIEYS
jgi:glutamyl endopeptidase